MDKNSTCDFQYETLTEMPQRGAPDVYIPDRGGVGADGILVKFWPAKGSPWVGMFAFGDMSAGKCDAFPGPGKNRLTVMAKGEAYIVNPDDPSKFDCVKSFPVIDFISAPKSGLALFYDYTNIVAYGENGLAWETDRISWDGIEISEITESEVVGRSWDAPNQTHVEFRVRLSDGRVQGGAAPNFP